MNPPEDMSGLQHPDENMFAAFLEGTLSDLELEAILAHLTHCQRCRSWGRLQKDIHAPEADPILSGLITEKGIRLRPFAALQTAAVLLLLAGMLSYLSTHRWRTFERSARLSVVRENRKGSVEYSELQSLRRFSREAPLALVQRRNSIWTHVSLVGFQFEPRRVYRICAGSDQIAITTSNGARWITVSNTRLWNESETP